MNLHTLLTDWSSWWWPLVVTHLWQSTLFLAIAGLAVLLLRSGSASTRYSAWLIGSLKFALPALVLAAPFGWLGVSRPVTVPYISPPALTTEQALVVNSPSSVVSSQPPAVSTKSRVYSGLTLIWLSGLVFLVARWFWNSRRLADRVRKSRPVEDPEIHEILRRVCQDVGWSRGIALLESPDLGTPAACGIWNPVILVPAGVGQGLTRAELTAVLMHEVVHIRRFDNLLAAAHRLLCCVFWFHPFIWLLERRLLAERELSCDEAVVAWTAEPRVYAAGILKICKFNLKSNPAGVSLASGSSLGRRIRMITSERPQRKGSLHRLVLGALVIGLMFLGLALAPTDGLPQHAVSKLLVEAVAAPQAIPEHGVKVGSCPQCPVTVLEARLKVEGNPVEALAPILRVRNDSKQAVKSFYLVLENPRINEKVYFKVAEPLEPGQEKAVTVRDRTVLVAIEEAANRLSIKRMPAQEAFTKLGDISALEAKAPTVIFADQTSFALKGYLPAPPPPPPAPPPPAPPAPPAPAERPAGVPPAAPPVPPAAPAPPNPPEKSSFDDVPGMAGVIGGVPGGVKGGVPGGVKGGVVGAVPGGVRGGVVGGVPGGVKGGVAPIAKEARPAPVPTPAPGPKVKEARPAPPPTPAPAPTAAPAPGPTEP